MIKMFFVMVKEILSDWMYHPVTLAIAVVLLSLLIFEVGIG
tara:strand:- start:1203 stop:1325 length:123 start_codon:yes stop_codon:yes gene_type:complete